jgi:hypothetical protein
MLPITSETQIVGPAPYTGFVLHPIQRFCSQGGIRTHNNTTILQGVIPFSHYILPDYIKLLVLQLSTPSTEELYIT